MDHKWIKQAMLDKYFEGDRVMASLIIFLVKSRIPQELSKDPSWHM